MELGDRAQTECYGKETILLRLQNQEDVKSRNHLQTKGLPQIQEEQASCLVDFTFYQGLLSYIMSKSIFE